MLDKILILLFAVLIIGCGESPVSSGGTGTDIGEAKVYGSVKLPGYVAGKDVSVTLRKQDYVPLSVTTEKQKQTKSGSDGTFILPGIKSGYYLVELFSKDSLCAIKRFNVSIQDSVVDLGNLVLDSLSTFSGTIFTDNKPASGAKLLVIGTDHTIPISADGSFSIRLPGGEQLLKVISSTGISSNDILFSDSSSGSVIHTSSSPLTVLDDFEDRDGYNNLTKLIGGGGWFYFTDKSNGGNSIILPSMLAGLVNDIDTSAFAWHGGSLHCTFQIDTTFSSPMALIGVDISYSKDLNSNKSWFDFSKMSAFTFMGKGPGAILVQFTCKPLHAPYEYTIYEVKVDLSSEWKKYTINSSEIPNSQPTTSSNEVVPWSSGNTAVSNINFLVLRNMDLWLDDITIEGMNPTDFLK